MAHNDPPKFFWRGRVMVDPADWDHLSRELDLWRAAGRNPSLWWRDDDAVADSIALQELQRIARVPVALAVIPLAPERPMEPSLHEALADWPMASVLQHGISHKNLASAGEKKTEFPTRRAADEVTAALAAGQAALRQGFGLRFVPVLTPPWNRLAEEWRPMLPRLGFLGLSRFGEPPYRNLSPINGLVEIDTHVDVIDWRGSRGFAGETACLGRLVAHLAARRTGAAQAPATGLLTHHLVHDRATWRFLEKLQDWLARRDQLSLFRAAADLWSPGL